MSARWIKLERNPTQHASSAKVPWQRLQENTIIERSVTADAAPRNCQPTTQSGIVPVSADDIVPAACDLRQGAREWTPRRTATWEAAASVMESPRTAPWTRLLLSGRGRRRLRRVGARASFAEAIGTLLVNEARILGVGASGEARRHISEVP